MLHGLMLHAKSADDAEAIVVAVEREMEAATILQCPYFRGRPDLLRIDDASSDQGAAIREWSDEGVAAFDVEGGGQTPGRRGALKASNTQKLSLAQEPRPCRRHADSKRFGAPMLDWGGVRSRAARSDKRVQLFRWERPQIEPQEAISLKHRRCAGLVCIALLAQSCTKDKAAKSKAPSVRGDVTSWSRVLRPSGDAATISISALVVDPIGSVFLHGTVSGALVMDGQSLTAPAGRSVAYVARFSPSGQLAWLTNLGRSWSTSAHSIAVDGSGGVWIQRSGVLNESTVSRRYDLLRLDGGTGAVIWSRTLGPNLDIETMALDPQGDRHDGPVVAGVVAGTTTIDGYHVDATGPDIFIGMLNASGEFRWFESFRGEMPGGPNALTTLAPPRGGYVDNDRALDLAVRPDRSLILLGRSTFDTTIGSIRYRTTPGDRLIAVGVHRDGRVAWSRALGDSPSDRPPLLAVAGAYVFITKSRELTILRDDGALVRSGELMAKSDRGSLVAISPSSGGSVLVAGNFVGVLNLDGPHPARGASDVFVAKISSDGRVLSTQFRSDSDSYSVAAISTSSHRRGLGILERRFTGYDVPPYAALIEMDPEH